MAQQDAEKQNKRRLRNPETVRERAQKAQAEAGKPGRSQLWRQKAATATSRPAGFIARLFSRPPLSWLVKVFKVLGRIIFPRYFRNSWRELRLVTWPNRRQTRQLTVAVLVFAVVFGALVSLVDYGLDKLFREVLLK